jgi:hypothetical protein
VYSVVKNCLVLAVGEWKVVTHEDRVSHVSKETREALRRAVTLSAVLGAALALIAWGAWCEVRCEEESRVTGPFPSSGMLPFELKASYAYASAPSFLEAAALFLACGLTAAPAAILEHLARTTPFWSRRPRLASLLALLAPFALTAAAIGNVGYVTALHRTHSVAAALDGANEAFFDPRLDGVWFFVIALAHALGLTMGMRLRGERLLRQCVLVALRSGFVPFVIAVDTGLAPDAAPRYAVFMTALGATLPLLWRLTDRIEARLTALRLRDAPPGE